MASFSSSSKTISLTVEVVTFKDEAYFIAFCPSLDLAGQGRTEEEALKSLNTTLEIFIEDTTSRGTIEKVLLDLGWRLQKKPEAIYVQPKFDPKGKYNIPTHLLSHKTQQIKIPV